MVAGASEATRGKSQDGDWAKCCIILGGHTQAIPPPRPLRVCGRQVLDPGLFAIARGLDSWEALQRGCPSRGLSPLRRVHPPFGIVRDTPS